MERDLGLYQARLGTGEQTEPKADAVHDFAAIVPPQERVVPGSGSFSDEKARRKNRSTIFLRSAILSTGNLVRPFINRYLSSVSSRRWCLLFGMLRACLVSARI